MNKTISEGEEKDMILKYCIEKGNKLTTSNVLKAELFPNTSIDKVNYLIGKIGNTIDPIAIVKMESRIKFIITSGITEIFIQQGGFTEKEKEEEQLKIKKEVRENLEGQIRELTRDNLRLNNWDIRFRWLIAIATFLTGFFIKYLIDN